MIKVFAWPPVGVQGSEWTEVAPVEVSRSMTTGAEFTSATQRKRRMASLRVPGRGLDRSGAGYIEMLKRCLEGVHAVRLYSYPINWHFGHKQRGAVPLEWKDAGVDLAWTNGGAELVWYDGDLVSGTPTVSQGFPAVAVIGLPPAQTIVRPGDFVTAYTDAGDASTAQVLAPAISDADGTVTIRLFTALAHGGVMKLGGSDTAVFKPLEYPRSTQPVRGEWSYDWSFREVFADEVGGFQEVNPWART